MRGKAERFAEHYLQAQLFWNSQTKVEKAHILRAFRFELARDGATRCIANPNQQRAAR